MVFWGDASTQHCWMRVFSLAVHDVCQAPAGLHCEAWGKTVGCTRKQCSGDRGKQVWGTRHTPLWCRYPMGSPTPPWRAGSQCAATSRPSFSKSLTHTFCPRGAEPLYREFFFNPRGRGRRRGKKKNSLPPPWRAHTQCCCPPGPRYNAAVAKGPVAGFRRGDMAAVCPHARHGGCCPQWRGQSSVCQPPPPPAAAGYCPKKKLYV